MLYITGIDNSSNEGYLLFETHTESIIRADVRCISKLIYKHGMKLKNAKIVEDAIILNEWPHAMQYRVTGFGNYFKNILLANIETNRLKITSSTATVKYINDEELKSLILKGDISNCSYSRDTDGLTFESTDTYKITRDTDYEKSIAEKYKEYTAKVKSLGLDISFKYIIEGKEVKILRYKGTSKRIILPNFITTIKEGAFNSSHIEEVSLNNGLKYIGSNAFRYNNIRSIEIPETVRFIGTGAFSGNEDLFTFNTMIHSMKTKITGFNETNFKLKSTKTIVTDKILRTIGR